MRVVLNHVLLSVVLPRYVSLLCGYTCYEYAALNGCVVVSGMYVFYDSSVINLGYVLTILNRCMHYLQVTFHAQLLSLVIV